MKKCIAILLTAALLLSLAGCADNVSSGEDLMKNVKPSGGNKDLNSAGTNTQDTLDPETEDTWDNALVGDFGLRLFRASFEEGKNTLISPYSVLTALAMTANGADGNTLTQMETVLGQSMGALNSWYKYGTAEDDFLHLANGTWFKDDPGFTVEEAFLQKNADFYDAGIYKAPFDENTLQDINLFVEENTDGMIKDILDKIPQEAVMYLVNALAFEAKWQAVYKGHQVHAAVFTTEGGTEQDIELMYSEEFRYLENDVATGFIKPYQLDRYAFVALLPKEELTVEEMLRDLDGKQLQSFLTNPQTIKVKAAIPKFETEFDTEMSEVLSAMGMPDAFDYDTADFSRLGNHTNGNIYISRVIHKTFISVAEQGTKAGAATVVEAAPESAMEVEEDFKRVTLDRPFVYMIVDTENNTPIFIGALMDMQ